MNNSEYARIFLIGLSSFSRSPRVVVMKSSFIGRITLLFAEEDGALSDISKIALFPFVSPSLV